MKKPVAKVLITAVAIGILICLVIILSNRWNAKDRQPDEAYLSLLKEAYSAVTKSYVEQPDKEKTVLSMVNGMLASLDPHSAYLPPEPYKEMEVQISGSFGGVGIELGMRDNRLTVIAPIDDTPAYRAGIQANDHIWKIDGTLTRGMTIADAVKRMRGEKGTPVSLSILRTDTPKPLTFNLVRDTIKIKSLRSRLIEPGIGFIRIAQFQERTGIDFRQALKDLAITNNGPLKGLVIDLRFNPGGVIGPCIEVANCFIGDDIANTLIVSTKGRMPAANHQYHATLGTKEPRYPIVVLINGGSASASEILAGALQDHKRAVIMGKQSFGKGSVQSIFPMKGNAALKLTTARYYTPSGRSIQAKGIVPDILVDSVKPKPVAHGGEGDVKEKDLTNRLAPDNKAEGSKTKGTVGEPAGNAETKASSKEGEKQTEKEKPLLDAEVAKDYQLTRAVELLRSLEMVRTLGGVVTR